MIVEEQITEILISIVRGSVATIVDSFLNVCKEVFKFVLILLFLYYFALQSFQLLDDIIPTIQAPSELIVTSEKENNDTPELDLMAHQIVGEPYLRIGAPDENLINQRADLLEQLEIEAEFEENLNKLRSEDGSQNSILKEVPASTSNIRNSDEIASATNLFISRIERESYETSRPSQTIKTSLGKKSKLRETTENGPTGTADANTDQEEGEELLQRFNVGRVIAINEEIVTDTNVPSIPEEQSPSYDEQYDHESFHRI